jgi:hypothetical protein
MSTMSQYARVRMRLAELREQPAVDQAPRRIPENVRLRLQKLRDAIAAQRKGLAGAGASPDGFAEQSALLRPEADQPRHEPHPQRKPT